MGNRLYMRTQDRIEEFKAIMRPCYEITGERFMQDIVTRGFFEAPASLSHHGTYTGGLFDHSLCVTKLLCLYTEKLGLVWQRPESPLIVGMFHDLCKTDDYVPIPAGGWQKNENRMSGHGNKSLLFLYAVKLTDEERICIRLHMGAYSQDPEEYSLECERLPALLYTSTADMAASHFLHDDPDAVEWRPAT